MKNTSVCLLCFILFALTFCTSDEKPERYGEVESELYLGKSDHQPLIVGLGGSEGGNAWASDRWEKTRNQFIDEGYAFLAIGYFGGKNTPEQLDRISIDAIHNTIERAAKNPLIDRDRIILIGGSKGAELALLMASYYSDIKGVVAIVPGYAAFPALTMSASTSSWMYQNKEVPYVPMPWSAVPSAMKRDLRSAFKIMIEDKEAVNRARIKIENINGFILLVSATQDEMWPSTEMSEEMMTYLENKDFKYAHDHIPVKGGHMEPLDHFDEIHLFLNEQFKKDSL